MVSEVVDVVNKNEIQVVSRNKKASHDYFILEKFEAGIQLFGTEIKSIRLGKVSVNEAYVEVKNEEAKIIGMHISKYKEGNIFNHDETRDRKLLLHKKEILKLQGRVQKESLTIIPLEVYIKQGLCKVQIALCQGKKNYDKREALKQEENRKTIEKAMKYKN